jgi:hypothetical protein
MSSLILRTTTPGTKIRGSVSYFISYILVICRISMMIYVLLYLRRQNSPIVQLVAVVCLWGVRGPSWVRFWPRPLLKFASEICFWNLLAAHSEESPKSFPEHKLPICTHFDTFDILWAHYDCQFEHFSGANAVNESISAPKSTHGLRQDSQESSIGPTRSGLPNIPK